MRATADIFNRELRRALKEGSVKIGARETKKALRSGAAKVVVFAKNCPSWLREEILRAASEGNASEVLFYEHTAGHRELGLVCGKPFAISTLCVTSSDFAEFVRRHAASEGEWSAAYMNTAKEWQKEKMEEAVGLWEGKSETGGE